MAPKTTSPPPIHLANRKSILVTKLAHTFFKQVYANLCQILLSFLKNDIVVCNIRKNFRFLKYTELKKTSPILALIKH